MMREMEKRSGIRIRDRITIHHRKLSLAQCPCLYQVWSTSVNAIVSYPAHRTTDRQTNRMIERPITLLRQPQRSSNSYTILHKMHKITQY